MISEWRMPFPLAWLRGFRESKKSLSARQIQGLGGNRVGRGRP